MTPMQPTWKRLIFATLMISLLFVVSGLSLAQPNADTQRYMVQLNTNFMPEGMLGTNAAITNQRINIQQTQANLLSDLSRDGLDVSEAIQFQTIPFMALELTAADVARLQSDPRVASVTLEARRQLYANNVDLTNEHIAAPQAWTAGFDGAGQVAVVMDTGLQNTHPSVSGQIVEEGCFTSDQTFTDATVSTTCPNGTGEQVGPGASAAVTQTATWSDHGQHVTGTIVGNDSGAQFNGVAPGAKVISVNVFSEVNSAQGAGQTALDADLIRAMEWVYGLRNTYDITAVNMSLGGGEYASEAACDSDSFNAGVRTAVDQLRSVGIAVIAASGNEYFTSSMGAPACLSNVISVGAVETTGTDSGLSSDTVAEFSNSASFLDLLAPGHWVWSGVHGNAYDWKAGTSMATPKATGAYTVLAQAYPNASMDQLVFALTETGVSVTDTRNSITKPRVDVYAALNMPVGAVTGTSPNDESVSETPTFTWGATAFASNYQIRVYDSSSMEVADFTAECDTPTCTATLSTPLTVGADYTWSVAGVNPRGTEGVESAALPFRVADLLGVPTNIQIDVASAHPVISWDDDAKADRYGVYVGPSLNNVGPVFFQWFEKATSDDMTCDAGTCTLTIPMDAYFPSGGSYDVYITAEGADGQSQGGIQGYAGPETFSLPTTAPAVLTSTQMTTLNADSGTPTLSFTAPTGATWYQVWIGTSAFETRFIQWFSAAQLGCMGGGTCTVEPTVYLENGSFEWWVQAYGPGGITTNASAGWGGPAPITVDAPALIAPAPQAPVDNTVVTSTPALTFAHTNGEWYEVWVGSADYTVTELVQWFHKDELGCEGGTCTVDLSALSVTLTPGAKAWTVRAYNPSGANDWSLDAIANFTVE